ncbi:NAD(P)-dependent oxidoreductase [Deinococcus radiotolerans]|uniref:3-hydroxyisobutyrate dehydrogenase n=1 Tax=Deinococcus radiotolerans TaxID=1309407 RepID=A0ABQ2FHG0_9DEIO|nr:NAD(P)-dependent oxidoreductase [Deinococcus radiotolerans]GGK89743.1 3-hydroxyisobutyrate dehydrogenase [Deinococcus radiotolerans]
MTTLAFLGLGAMGAPMAAHLATHARDQQARVLVWNRTAGKAEAHAQAHGTQAATLAQVAAADVIFTCLPTSAEVDEVLDQMRPHLRPGATWVDCTSGHPEAATRQAAELAAQQVTFLDAPVSGGTVGAQQGRLTVMVGGNAAALDAVRPHLAFAGKVVHVGDTGTGFAVKAVNNALLGVTLWATGEGLAVLGRAGVNLSAALEVINASSGRSNSSENLIPQRVLTREFPATFALGLLAKDAGIATDLTQSVQGSAPVLAQVAALLRAAQRVVGAQEDHTAALKFIEAMNETVIQ